MGSRARVGVEGSAAPELSEKLETWVQVKPMLEVPFDAKQEARRAWASSEIRFVAANSKTGGAWMAMFGIGIALREIEMVKAGERAPRKSDVVRTISKVVPPSSSAEPSSGVATLPSASKRAWIA
jgi:hypothetical protein